MFGHFSIERLEARKVAEKVIRFVVNTYHLFFKDLRSSPLKIGPKVPQKETSSYSNHPMYQGQQYVSFREGITFLSKNLPASFRCSGLPSEWFFSQRFGGFLCSVWR